MISVRLIIISAFLSIAAVINNGCHTHLIQPLTSAPLPHSYHLEIISRIPHNNQIFTQGLVIHNRMLYESGGLYRKSTLRRYSLDHHTLSPQTIHNLADHYFAEDITFYKGSLIQLTWKEMTALRYDLNLNPIGMTSYHGIGWGICTSEQGLFTSDGSANLTLRTPSDFTPKKTLFVKEHNLPISNLNALTLRKHPKDNIEYIYANVWFENDIIEINSLTGNVTARIDASTLPAENPNAQTDPNNVLNGIAYDFQTDTFWITGKRWNWLYNIRLKEKP
ncbi:hypothetical protein COTS27_00338 [Spirochaetota bacterium]|nr:hypothetical protein COTS27_00338 [Spirochaetota bacterium]